MFSTDPNKCHFKFSDLHFSSENEKFEISLLNRVVVYFMPLRLKCTARLDANVIVRGKGAWLASVKARGTERHTCN